MITKEIIEYIKTETQKGVSREVISASLIASNWSQVDIDEAFGCINTNTFVSASSVQPQLHTSLFGKIANYLVPTKKLSAGHLFINIICVFILLPYVLDVFLNIVFPTSGSLISKGLYFFIITILILRVIRYIRSASNKWKALLRIACFIIGLFFIWAIVAWFSLSIWTGFKVSFWQFIIQLARTLY